MHDTRLTSPAPVLAALTRVLAAPTPVLAALVSTLLLAIVSLAGCVSATARTLGPVPPHDPARNCFAHARDAVALSLRGLDRCRANEHVGRLVLPVNYTRLDAAEKLFVVLDLERVNRGLAPIVGLSRPLDRLAQEAANAQTDPGFPAGRYYGGGSIWAYGFSVVGADVEWMYEDGWGRTVINLNCTSPRARGCWGHRNIVLMRSRARLVAGAGVRKLGRPERGMPKASSYAFEVLAGYPARDLTFSWARELRYFRTPPTLEPRKR